MQPCWKPGLSACVLEALTAVNNLSIRVNPGEIVALIGPNGAGKTTAFNMITGVYTPTEGRIIFDGVGITGSGRSDHQAGNCQNLSEYSSF